LLLSNKKALTKLWLYFTYIFVILCKKRGCLSWKLFVNYDAARVGCWL